MRDAWRRTRLASAFELFAISFRSHPWWTALLFASGVGDALVAPLSAALTGLVVSIVVDGGPASRLVTPLIAYAVLQGHPIGELRWRLSDTLGNRIGDVLDERVTRAYLDPPGIAHLDDPSVRDAADRAASFWNSSILEGALSVLVSRGTGIAGAVLLGLSAGWPVAVVVTCGWLVVSRRAWAASKKALDVQFEQSPELRDSQYAVEMGVDPAVAKDVRVFGLPSWLLDRHTRLWRSALAPVWRQRRCDVAPNVALGVAIGALNGGALAWIGYAALRGSISPGALTVAVQALLQVGGLGRMPYGSWEMEYGLRAVPANRELLALVGEERFTLRGSLPADGLPSREIRFQGVAFAYPGRDVDVLAGVDLVIPAGSSLAIVGANGAGKTTLLKLLCRFLDPTAGSITVDGVLLADVDPVAWHARIGGLFQDFVRYPLSARDNVVADDTLPLDVARRAAERAGILDVIEALDEGWSTPLTRRFVGGTDLSGGQWQRVALARALAAIDVGAGLLVLDEPTAHLDAKAEADLYDRFLELTAGVTTVLISHRFSTVRRAEHIAVLDGGRITEFGTHDELVARRGTYAAMFAVQADRFVSER